MASIGHFERVPDILRENFFNRLVVFVSADMCVHIVTFAKTLAWWITKRRGSQTWLIGTIRRFLARAA